MTTVLHVLTGMIAIPLVLFHLLISFSSPTGASAIPSRWRNSWLNRALIAIGLIFLAVILFKALGGPSIHFASSYGCLAAGIGGMMLIGGSLGAYYGNRLWAGFDSSVLPPSETTPDPSRVRLAHVLGGTGALLLTGALIVWLSTSLAMSH